MNIQAIIMAGGEGVRLRPMTLTRPKPMVPLLGKPVMEYTLQLLKKHGLHHAAATLWYQPKAIRAYFGNGERFGMNLSYFEETAPLGTAGSVCMAREQIKDTFFVLSGDGLTDCDLTDALRFHREKGALATLVLKRVDVPLSYGVVMTGEDGRIERFLEKPDWSRAYSNLVNTGIYILEPEILDDIPTEGQPDFGKDIFPSLLKHEKALYGYEMQGYWCDVGSQSAYLQAQMDLLQGKVGLDCQKGVHEEAGLQPGVHLRGSFYIGKDTGVLKGAVIKNSVIGEHCNISGGAVIENCCIWDHAVIGPKARLSGCVICDEARVQGGAQLQHGCALGQGAVVGAHGQLQHGVKLWPGVKLPSGTVTDENVYEQESGGMWEEEHALCHSPMECCRWAFAFANTLPGGRVVTGYLDDVSQQAVFSGAMAAWGADVLQGGFMTIGMLSQMVVSLNAAGGALVMDGGILFLDRHGLPLSTDMRRKMENLMRSGQMKAPYHKGTLSRLEGAEEIYLSLNLPGDEKTTAQPIAIFCAGEDSLHLAVKGLKRLGYENIRFGSGETMALRKGEEGFLLSADGRELYFLKQDGEKEKTAMDLLRLKLMCDREDMLFDLPEVPRAASLMHSLQPFEESEACYRQQRGMLDGVAGLWMVCSQLKERTMEELLREVPRAHILCRDVQCRERDKSRVLYALCRRAALPYTLGRGMQVQHEKGYATIVPDGVRPAMRIVSEGMSMEAARELCDFYDQEIQRTLKTTSDL